MVVLTIVVSLNSWAPLAVEMETLGLFLNHCLTKSKLPLFSLPLVLFPDMILPLQIFEFHYRMMMHTLLQTDLHFGIIYTDADTGTALDELGILEAKVNFYKAYRAHLIRWETYGWD